jgi:hypothetical protein
MSEAAEPQFFIAWKGANMGPFTLAQIQEKLAAGEVSRMHQVQVGGRWLSVDEFLSKHESSERQAAKAKEAQAKSQEVQLRQEYEARLASEHAHQQSLTEQLEAAERRARLLPAEVLAPPPPPVVSVPQHAPAGPTFQQPSHYAHTPAASETTRTSGFAITAFIFALCNFVPFLNFVSWVLALVFGHVALRDINHNPSLAGRGLAIAALCITYFLLVLGLTFGVLMALDGRLRF